MGKRTIPTLMATPTWAVRISPMPRLELPLGSESFSCPLIYRRIAPRGASAVYINGQENDSDPNGNTNLGSAYIPNAIKPLYIGSRSDNTHFWNGSMADVALYNYVLTPAQISNHFSIN